MYVSDARLKILLTLMERGGVGVDQYDETKIASLTQIANALAAGLEEDEMAASKQYAISETTVIFGGEVGDDIALTCTALANGAGRQSAFADLGPPGTARSDRFCFRVKMDGWQATPTVTNTLDIHVKTSDGTTPDNDDGTADAAISAENKLKNLDYIDEIVCDEAAANIPAATSGYVRLPDRYVGFGVWNRGGSALKNDAAVVKIYLTPYPLQQQ